MEKSSVFKYGPYTFDVASGLKIARTLPVQTMPFENVSDCAEKWLAHKKGGKLVLGVSINEEWALKNADLSKPVLLLYCSPRWSFLIDGNHRLYRAWQEHKPLLFKAIEKRKDIERIAQGFLPDWLFDKNLK